MNNCQWNTQWNCETCYGKLATTWCFSAQYLFFTFVCLCDATKSDVATLEPHGTALLVVQVPLLPAPKVGQQQEGCSCGDLHLCLHSEVQKVILLHCVKADLGKKLHIRPYICFC